MKYYSMINKETIEEVNKITGRNYDVVFNADALEDMIEDLIDSYNAVVEKFEDYVKEVDEFYKPKHSDPYDFYGVSKEDF